MTGRTDLDWKQLLQRYGLGTVLALLLTMFLLKNVDAAQQKALDKLDALTAALASHEATMRLDAQRNILIQRQICFNTAKDEGQRSGCFEASR